MAIALEGVGRAFRPESGNIFSSDNGGRKLTISHDERVEKVMMGSDGMMGAFGMGFMGVFGLLVLLLVILAIAALIKYLRS